MFEMSVFECPISVGLPEVWRNRMERRADSDNPACTKQRKYQQIWGFFMLACMLHTQEVRGSSPCAPTKTPQCNQQITRNQGNPSHLRKHAITRKFDGFCVLGDNQTGGAA